MIAGTADHIGEVTPSNGKRYWYRLPTGKLTVLGETHGNKNGNVQDVLKGLQTARFMYEPINVLSAVGPDIEYTGTWQRLAESDTARTEGMNRSNPYGNWLESAALKAMTAMFMFESGFDKESKGFVDDPKNPDWDDAPQGGYTLGERTAFYYVMAIQIASDVARYMWDPVNQPGPLVDESDELTDVYVQHQKMLDALRKTPDAREGPRPEGHAGVRHRVRALGCQAHRRARKGARIQGAQRRRSEAATRQGADARRPEPGARGAHETADPRRQGEGLPARGRGRRASRAPQAVADAERHRARGGRDGSQEPARRGEAPVAEGVTPSSADEARAEAAVLHARACELAAAAEYGEALALCRRALKLDDDAAIRARYDRLLATIGPD